MPPSRSEPASEGPDHLGYPPGVGNEQRQIVAADPSLPNPIQRAVDALGGPGLVHLPAGEYTVETTVKLPGHVTLVGDGAHLTTVRLAPRSNCHIFTNTQHDGGNGNIELRGFTIEGDMRSQEKPAGLEAVSYACGGYFKGVTHLVIRDLVLNGVRQSGFHFSHCTNVELRGVRADRLGWSGVSTSATDDLRMHDVVITNAGLDQRHSGVHLDGGRGAYLGVVVDGATGNGIMLDSKFAPLSDVVVHGVARKALRGLSLSGDHDHDLSNVWVTGDYSNNREVGLLVDSASFVFIVGATFGSNGRAGIVVQGRGQVRHCVVSDCNITGSPIAIHERDDNHVAYVCATTAVTGDSDVRPLGVAPSAALRPLARRVRSRVARVARARGVAPKSARVAVGAASTALKTTGAPAAAVSDDDSFEGTCNVCGERGVFVRRNASLREGYRCRSCQASLRYRGQADAILRTYAKHGATSIAALVHEPDFAALSVWEPGVLGAFRPHFVTLPGYVMSDFWPAVTPGAVRDGVRCEDLMALTFGADSFDLVVSSDIFEHVRRPFIGFAELHRVLRPGGRHIFSIPVQLPWQALTVERIDTSGDEDVNILEPRYHLGPNRSQHIVYNDFGRDLIDGLSAVGFDTEVIQFSSPSAEASRLLTFCSTKR